MTNDHNTIMKRFFWLALLLNLGLLIYFNLELFLPASPEVRLSELSPEKIKLLSQAEIDALPLKSATTTSQSEIANCYEWGTFSDVAVDNALKMLAGLNIQASAKTVDKQQPKRYWVYKAPLKTVAEAQKKAAELKALGVKDLFVVQEEKWKNAISFGIFEDEQLATKLVQELRAKGIKNIEKSIRSNDVGQHSLILNALTDKQIAEINQLKPNFPAAELKQTACN